MWASFISSTNNLQQPRELVHVTQVKGVMVKLTERLQLTTDHLDLMWAVTEKVHIRAYILCLNSKHCLHMDCGCRVAEAPCIPQSFAKQLLCLLTGT